MATTIATEPLTHERISIIRREIASDVRNADQFNRQFEELDVLSEVSDLERLDLRTRARANNERIEAAVAPIWEHLGQFERLSEQVQSRPRALRGVGAQLLPAIADISFFEGGDVMAKALIKWAVDKRTATSDVPTWNAVASQATSNLEHPVYRRSLEECLRDGTINVATELHERDVAGFLSFCHRWVEEREARAALADAGIRIGRIEAGEIRNMDPDDFAALGEYLGCCIGGDEHGPTYVQRYDDGEAAYLCVYGDEKVPVLLVEVYLQGDLPFGDTQSRFERGGREETIEQLRAWLVSEGRQALGLEAVAAMSTTPPSAPLPAKPDQQAPHRPVKAQQG